MRDCLSMSCWVLCLLVCSAFACADDGDWGVSVHLAKQTFYPQETQKLYLSTSGAGAVEVSVRLEKPASADTAWLVWQNDALQLTSEDDTPIQWDATALSVYPVFQMTLPTLSATNLQSWPAGTYRWVAELSPDDGSAGVSDSVTWQLSYEETDGISLFGVIRLVEDGTTAEEISSVTAPATVDVRFSLSGVLAGQLATTYDVYIGVHDPSWNWQTLQYDGDTAVLQSEIAPLFQWNGATRTEATLYSWEIASTATSGAYAWHLLVLPTGADIRMADFVEVSGSYGITIEGSSGSESGDTSSSDADDETKTIVDDLKTSNTELLDTHADHNSGIVDALTNLNETAK